MRERVFGTALSRAERYAELLTSIGVGRGLIGPREADRIWDRHLLNCAVVGEALPPDCSVCDVGSGAGLPGIPLALVRPDVAITLVEPSQRRVAFLEEVLGELGLTGVSVVRSRAEDLAGQLTVDRVVARAVAPLERLARWSLPLVSPDGSLLALKGSRAEVELAEAAEALRRYGAGDGQIERYGVGLLERPTTVVRVARAARPGDVSRRRKGSV
ncbi:MAG: 16S rRNA (guanine(527)-N(7))-methyltransferase RsmG [Actinomycetes bacterium]